MILGVDVLAIINLANCVLHMQVKKINPYLYQVVMQIENR
jgi:hypothetical protein